MGHVPVEESHGVRVEAPPESLCFSSQAEEPFT